MNKEYYTHFIKTWLPQLKTQYKRAMRHKHYNTVSILKENLYENMNLEEKQKDYIWEIITRSK